MQDVITSHFRLRAVIVNYYQQHKAAATSLMESIFHCHTQTQNAHTYKHTVDTQALTHTTYFSLQYTANIKARFCGGSILFNI